MGPPRQVRKAQPDGVRQPVRPSSGNACRSTFCDKSHTSALYVESLDLFFATILNAIFLYYVVVLYRNYSDKLSKKIFNYSILYLSLIFTAFLVDHYYKFIFI